MPAEQNADTKAAEQSKSAPDIGAIVKAEVSSALRDLVPEILKGFRRESDAATTGAQQKVDAAAPKVPDRYASAMTAIGIEDPDELAALADVLKPFVEKHRAKVENPIARAALIKAQQAEARTQQIERERDAERKDLALERSLTAAVSRASRLGLRQDVKPEQVVSMLRGDGLISRGEDGALLATAADARTPTGKSVEETIDAYVTANPWLKAPPSAVGGPQIPAGAGVPGTPSATSKQFVLTDPKQARAWFAESSARSPGFRDEIKAMLDRRGDQAAH